MWSSPTRRWTLALVTATALAASGCGGDGSDDYAGTWNDACRDLSSAYKEFQTAIATAADSSPDAGDAAARAPLPASVVAAELRKPAQALRKALDGPLSRVRAADPPQRYAAWHRRALGRIAAQTAVLDDGVARLGRGDGDALAQLALGAFGPAAADAPASLRDATPDCTALR